MNYLEKRFLNETGNEVEMLFRAGKVVIYQKWLEKLERENEHFYEMIKPDFPHHEPIIELAESREYTISSFFPKKSSILECERKTVPISPSLLSLSDPLEGHLVCNGLYEELEYFLPRFITTRQFTVGFCLPKEERKAFKENEKCYHQLYRVLQQQSLDSISEETMTKGNYKAYVLKGGRR